MQNIKNRHKYKDSNEILFPDRSFIYYICKLDVGNIASSRAPSVGYPFQLVLIGLPTLMRREIETSKMNQVLFQ